MKANQIESYQNIFAGKNLQKTKKASHTELIKKRPDAAC